MDESSSPSNRTMQSLSLNDPSFEGPYLEIIDTEQKFCNKLALLDQQFARRLRAEIQISGQKATQITENQVDKWFTGVTSLHNEHEKLLKMLSAGGILGLGIRFKTFCRDAKNLYGDHAAAFQEISDDIRQARTENPWLNSFIRVSETVAEDTLLSLRISPIQRIPRYCLMLNAVMDTIPEDCLDERRAVQEAMDAINTICRHIDESASYTEHHHLVRRIERDLFHGRISLRNGADHRKFVHQGLLYKMFAQTARHVTKMKRYTFLLFSDCLIYADLAAAHDRKFKHALDLSQMKVIDISLGQIPGISNAFRIVSMTKVIVLCASSADEKRFWMNLLLDQIDAAASESREGAQYQDIERSIRMFRPSLGSWPKSGIGWRQNKPIYKSATYEESVLYYRAG